MPESIRDGKGTGYLVGVTKENRLLTTAVTVPLRTHISSAHGQSYTFNTGVLTLSAPDTWHWAMWWANTSVSRNMHIESIEIDWNGGSTNYNRPLQMKNVLPTAGAPTGNATLATASNNNKLSKNSAELTIYKWDGTGAGMTNSAGPSGSDTFHTQGRGKLDFRGFVLNGLGDAVGVMVKSPEVGDFSLGLGVYFAEKEAII
jgi:hypothetical protein